MSAKPVLEDIQNGVVVAIKVLESSLSIPIRFRDDKRRVVSKASEYPLEIGIDERSIIKKTIIISIDAYNHSTSDHPFTGETSTTKSIHHTVAVGVRNAVFNHIQDRIVIAVEFSEVG